MNSAAVATAAPVMASIATLSFLLLLAADIRAPVTAPPIIAFFCSTSKSKGTKQGYGKNLNWKIKYELDNKRHGVHRLIKN